MGRRSWPSRRRWTRNVAKGEGWPASALFYTRDVTVRRRHSFWLARLVKLGQELTSLGAHLGEQFLPLPCLGQRIGLERFTDGGEFESHGSRRGHRRSREIALLE